MWQSVSSSLRSHCPRFHRKLKHIVADRFQDGLGLRVPRLLAGHLVWTSPRLLTSDAPERHVIRWIQERLGTGDTFFDIGAHYGWMSIAAALRVKSPGRVVAFEPSPALLNILSYHKRVNRLNQMQIIAKAVSNRDSASVPFYLVNDGLSTRNSLTIAAPDTPYVAPERKSQLEVPSLTLDRFCAESQIVPDLIKVDVEGAELLVLQGAERLLEALHPALIVAVHPYWLPLSQNVEQIFDLLKRHNYEVREQNLVRFGGGYVADYLCTHESDRTRGKKLLSRTRPKNSSAAEMVTIEHTVKLAP